MTSPAQRAAWKRHYDRHAGTRRAASRDQYASAKALGVCPKCKAPAAPFTYCLTHRRAHARS